mgnify:CR=1 FL=1
MAHSFHLLCGKGLVVDFCMQVAPSDIRAFMEKWDLYPETESLREFTQEQRMQIDLDSPMNLDFHAILHLNGKDLNPDNGCGTATTPVCPRSIPWETRPDWLWNTMAWTQISVDALALRLSLGDQAQAGDSQPFPDNHPGPSLYPWPTFSGKMSGGYRCLFPWRHGAYPDRAGI